jgi:membrane protease YdiL (CAAX protease family)
VPDLPPTDLDTTLAPAAPPLDAARPAGPPAVRDPWSDARPFRYDGALERNGFTPIWTGLLALVVAWVLFQAVANIGVAVSLVMQHLQSGATEPPTPESLLAMMGENGRLLLGWNAVGQLIGFGVLTWLFARGSTSAPAPFLRLRRPGAEGLVLAALGWAALYPIVIWLGDLSKRIPLPEWVELMDQMRTDLIESLLLGGDLGTPYLLLTVAVVPALFEELLFRGYLQRQAERRLSVPAGLVAVGVLFGAYHMSVTQLVPLSVLGIYLGFVVWATGSLWAGVLVHLLNNGLAVVVAGMARNNPALDVESLEGMGVKWYVALVVISLGAAGVAAIGRRLVALRTTHTGGGPDARPLPAAPIPALP